MSEQKPALAPSPIDSLIVQIDQAVNARALYSPGHPNVVRSAERLVAAVEAACAGKKQDAITLLAVGDDIVVDNEPLRKASLYHEQFVRCLTRRGVERLTLARGITAAECHQLLEPLAMGGAPANSDHVIVGRVEVKALDSEEESARGEDPLSLESLDQARDAFTAFRSDKRTGLRRLEHVVWGLMEALARATRETLPLAPLKNHDEYTFVHSVNVSMLTLSQARSLGIQDDKLHNIGVAALLHDIGKLRIPLEVLNKPGKLEGREWEIMMSHAEQGARHLCGIEGSQPLSVLVAYEHHMRWDGKPAYPVPRTPRTPTLAAQLTSISDVFDATCTTRPYSKARPKEVAIGVLKKRAGTFHDPMLVANFARLVGVEFDAAGEP